MLELLLTLSLLLLPQSPAKPACANVWHDQAGDIEAFLKSAAVEKVVELPIGVTKPRRAYTAPGGLAASFAWKPLRPGVQSGYFESYKSEIAAYRLDRMLDLHMVPPIVERNMDGKTGAAVYWIENTRPWSVADPP